MKKRLAVCLMAAVLALTLSACDGNSSATTGTASGSSDTSTSQDENVYSLVDESKLTIASSFDCLPYAGKSVDVMNGFAYELMNEIASRMGLETSWQSVGEGNSEDALTRATTQGQRVVGGDYKRADIALVFSGDVPEGLEGTDAYLQTPVVMVAKKSTDFKSTDALTEGSRVGVMTGSATEAWAKENLSDKGVEFIEYTSSTELFSALQARNVDAVIAEQAMANYQLRVAYGDCEIEQVFDDQVQYRLYVNSENKNLIDQLNLVLTEIDEDGKLDELSDAWLAEVDNSRGKTDARIPPQGAETHYKGTN